MRSVPIPPSTLSALLLLAAGATARADPGASVAVLPIAPLFEQVPQRSCDRVAAQLVAGLAERPGVRAVAAGMDTARRAAVREKLAADREAAKGALGELEAARSALSGSGGALALEQAVNAVLRGAGALDTLDPLVPALTALAQAQRTAGDEAKARQSVSLLVTLRPELSPVPLDDVRASLLAQPRGSMRISSFPSGADVLVDGRPLGRTPLLVTELVPGRHAVRAMLEDGTGSWSMVEVKPGAEAGWDVDFAGERAKEAGALSQALAANRFDAAAQAAARGIAKGAGAAFALAGALQKQRDGLVLLTRLVRVEDGAQAQLPTARLDEELLDMNLQLLELTDAIQAQLANFTPGTAGDALTPRGRPMPGVEVVTTVSAQPAPEPAPQPSARSERLGAPIVASAEELAKEAAAREEQAASERMWWGVGLGAGGLALTGAIVWALLQPPPRAETATFTLGWKP